MFHHTLIHASLLAVTMCFVMTTIAPDASANMPRKVRVNVRAKVKSTPVGVKKRCLVFKAIEDNARYYPTIRVFNQCKQQVIVKPEVCEGDCREEIVLPQKEKVITAYVKYNDKGMGELALMIHLKPDGDSPTIKLGQLLVTTSPQRQTTTTTNTPTPTAKTTAPSSPKKTSQCSAVPSEHSERTPWSIVMCCGVALVALRGNVRR